MYGQQRLILPKASYMRSGTRRAATQQAAWQPLRPDHHAPEDVYPVCNAGTRLSRSILACTPGLGTEKDDGERQLISSVSLRTCGRAWPP